MYTDGKIWSNTGNFRQYFTQIIIYIADLKKYI